MDKLLKVGLGVIAAGLGAALLSGCALPGSSLYVEAQQTELERRLAGTPVKVIRRGDDFLLSVPNDVTFAFDQAEIAPSFFPVLETIAEVLVSNPETQVHVTGHADSMGVEAYNQALSERRAAAVGLFLGSRGVRYGRLTTDGEGERSPVASNETDEGRAQNRRVEVLVQPVRPTPLAFAAPVAADDVR